MATLGFWFFLLILELKTKKAVEINVLRMILLYSAELAHILMRRENLLLPFCIEYYLSSMSVN
jgi:hypothetical protein